MRHQIWRQHTSTSKGPGTWIDANLLYSGVSSYSVKKRHDASIAHHSSYYLMPHLSSLPLIPRRTSRKYQDLGKLG